MVVSQPKSKEIFLAEISCFQRYGEGPVEFSGCYKSKIMHAAMRFDYNLICLSDVFEGQQASAGNRITLQIDFADGASIDTVYNYLSHGGKEEIPLQDTYWNCPLHLTRNSLEPELLEEGRVVPA